MRNVDSQLRSRVLSAFRPKVSSRSHSVSCRRSTWLEREAKRLQNNVILRCEDGNLIEAVRECQTIASETSSPTGCEWAFDQQISQLFCCAHISSKLNGSK